MKDWETIADNLSKAGWSWGCVSSTNHEGRQFWVVDAHRGDGKRLIVRADEKVFEAPGVEPVFLNQDQAIDYAQTRACFRSGEIRVLDANGKLERTIAFNETNRKL